MNGGISWAYEWICLFWKIMKVDNRNSTPVTYIKGTSETISRILQPYNIRVAHKPTTTLRYFLTNAKDRNEPNNRQGEVYKIKRWDWQKP